MVTRQAGPFEYYQEIHWGVNGDTIRADATAPDKNAQDLQALATELEGDSTRVVNGLEGGVKAVAQNPGQGATATNSLAVSGFYAVALIRKFATMVDTFDTSVNHCNWRYRTELATAMRWTAQAVASTPDKSDDGQASEAHLGPQTKANIQPDYNAALTKIDDDADTVAADFDAGPTPDRIKALVVAGLFPLSVAASVPGLTLTDAEKASYYKNALANLSPEEQKQWLLNNKDHLDPTAAQYVDPSVQGYFADTVAHDITSGNVTKDTVRWMTFFQAEQPFAHQLYGTVTPDQMATTIQTLSNRAFPYQASADPNRDFAQAELYKHFLDAAGVCLATYTKSTGAFAPATDAASTWATAITDDTKAWNGAALTLLIKHGGEQTSFDPTFLSDVTGRVYDWERSHDGAPVWSPMNDKLGQYGGIKDPSLYYGDPKLMYPNHAGYTQPYDGLANLLAAMKHTPDASVQFFNGSSTSEFKYSENGHDQTMQVNDRMRYLLLDRRWPCDSGDGMGTALENAMLTYRDAGDHNPNFDTPGEHSAKLVTQMMTMLGQEIGTGNDGWHGDRGWQIPHGMTDSVGKVLAGYVPDLYRIAQGSGDVVNGSDSVFGNDPGEQQRLPGDPVGFMASNATLAKVLQSEGMDDNKAGLQFITNATLNYHNAVNGHIIDQAVMPDGTKPTTLADLEKSLGPDGKPFSNTLNSEASNGGQLLSMVMTNGFTGGKAGEAADQQSRDEIAKAFGAATSLIPGPQGKVAGFLYGQGTSLIGEQLAKQPPSVTDAWASNSDTAAKNSLQMQTYNVLLQHGFLNGSDSNAIPPSCLATDPTTGQLMIKPGLTNGSNDGIDAATASQWQSWLTTHAPSDFGQSSVNAYASNLPGFK